MDSRLREADTAWGFGCGCWGEITVGRCFVSVIGTEGRTEESKARRRRVEEEAVAVSWSMLRQQRTEEASSAMLGDEGRSRDEASFGLFVKE